MALERHRPHHDRLLTQIRKTKRTVKDIMAELFPNATYGSHRRYINRWKHQIPGFAGAYEEAMAPRHQDLMRRIDMALGYMEEDTGFMAALEKAGVRHTVFFRRVKGDADLQRRWDDVRLAEDFEYIENARGLFLRKADEIKADGDDFRRGNALLQALRTRAGAAARLGRESPLEDWVDAKHVHQRSEGQDTKQLLAALVRVADRLNPPVPENPEQEKFEVIEIDPETGEWLGKPKELTA